jgi:hypothetical protein
VEVMLGVGIFSFLLFLEIFRFFLFLGIFRFSNYPDMWDLVLVSKITPFSSHLSADKWVMHVRFAVNWLQTCDLSKLQSVCEKVVDFYFQNVKWYHLVNFA